MTDQCNQNKHSVDDMILTYENEGIRHPDAARRAFFYKRCRAYLG